MWQITPIIRSQRRTIAEFLDTFMSGDEHFQLAIQIHTIVAENRKAGCPLDEVLERLDNDLQETPITSVTGDAVNGWRSRKKFLTERQRAVVLEYVKSIYVFGGKFEMPRVITDRV